MAVDPHHNMFDQSIFGRLFIVETFEKFVSISRG